MSAGHSTWHERAIVGRNRRATRGPLVILLVVMAAGALFFETVGLRAWVVEGPMWNISRVPFYVNPANTNGLADGAVITAFQTAASAWSTQSSANFSFTYAGTTTINTAANTGVNVAMFRPDAYGAVAATTYWWADSNNHLLTADVVLWESDFQYFTHATDCSGGMFVEDVATHEFGHALGLAHSTVATATMYPNISSYCATDWESLDPDDIAGVESLYPPASSGVQPPAAPSQLAVAVNSASPTSSLMLSWADHATNASGYRLERSPDAVNFSQIAQLGSNAVAFVDSGLAVGATYYYRVSAYDSAGSSNYSNLASGQTQAITQAPTAPSSPSPANGATGVNTSVGLSWKASTQAQTYDVYFGTTSTPGLYASNASSPSLSVASLNAGTPYYWFVVAKNNVGTTSGPLWSFTTKAAAKAPAKGKSTR